MPGGRGRIGRPTTYAGRMADPLLTPPAGRPAISVCLMDALTGAVLAADAADDIHRTASIGKIVLLAEVAVRFVDGRLSRAEQLIRTADDAVADSGLWQHLATDSLSAADCAVLIGAVSDNLATNVVLRRVGLISVSERGRTIGLTHTALLDRVRDVRPAVRSARAVRRHRPRAGRPDGEAASRSDPVQGGVKADPRLAGP